MDFSSKLVSDAVNAFAGLPGIGKKSALRMVLHLLKKDVIFSETLSDAISQLRKNIKFCTKCHNISDREICSICDDPRRQEGVLCVVESIRDVMAIEDTAHFRGRYHVLGGVISPIDGVGPERLNIDSLMNRVKKEAVTEVILAISPTIEGDTTSFYISKQLQPLDVNVSSIARGVAFGGELEYVDEVTLGRSIAGRTPFQLNGY